MTLPFGTAMTVPFGFGLAWGLCRCIVLGQGIERIGGQCKSNREANNESGVKGSRQLRVIKSMERMCGACLMKRAKLLGRDCLSMNCLLDAHACVALKRDSVLSLPSHLLPHYTPSITRLHTDTTMSTLQQPPPTSGTTSNVLDTDTVLSLLQRLLPTRSSEGQQGLESVSSTSSTPESTVILGSQYEGLAALSHAIMTAVGFRLVGLGEDDSLGSDRTSIEGT